MAGFVYEVVVQSVSFGVNQANVFHVWDGDELQTPDDVADVFENNWVNDMAALMVNNLTFVRITVTPLDVGNLQNAISRQISVAGTGAGDGYATGGHVYVKLLSDDNGFRAGGKLMGGLTEDAVQDNVVVGAHLGSLQTVFDDLLTDLAAAGLALAIYRPTLSSPGAPSISISSVILVKGLGTNNRRQAPFQA